jgi:hypothetical protein
LAATWWSRCASCSSAPPIPICPAFRDLNTVFLGWATLALAVVGGIAYWRKVRVWVWTSLIFGVLTLGPLLQINGRYRFDLDGLETTVPLPFALLHFIPVIKANRAPNRNSVLLMLGLAVLAGYGVYWLLGWLRRNRATGRAGWLTPVVATTLTAAILFEHLALPFPLSDARVPAVYDQIAAEPGDFSVLQLPLGWRNSFGVFGPEKTLLQYYQTAHGKPMLGGNISRAPAFKLEYFQRIPYFQALTEIEFGRPVAPEVIEAAAAQAADLMYLYDTRYVLLYPPIPGRPPYTDTWQDAWDFVKRTLPLEPEPFWAQDGIEAYRVLQPGGGDQFYLNLGEAGTYPYRGEGWDAAEVDAPYEASATWATDSTSRVFAPLRQVDPDATYTVQVRAHPFVYPGSAAQQVQLTVNGAALETQPLPDGWQTLAWSVPGALLHDGLNRLELGWATPLSRVRSSPATAPSGRPACSCRSTPISKPLPTVALSHFSMKMVSRVTVLPDVAGSTSPCSTRAPAKCWRRSASTRLLPPLKAKRLVEFVAGIAAGAPVLGRDLRRRHRQLERGGAGGAEFTLGAALNAEMYAATISPSPASRARRRERRRR